MTERDPTCIGRVRHVLGATVTVALDADLAGVAPVYHGRLYPVGQIGSLVRFPQGIVDLIGSVTLLGISELSGPLEPAEALQVGERWLQVELVGQIDRGSGRFERGVAVYPGLDDPAHFTTAEELRSVFPEEGENYLRLGQLAAAEHVPVCLDVSKLVIRHSAVVGSTGSGKTSAVASLLQGFEREGWSAPNIIVIDPHGEYSAALTGIAAIRSVLGTHDSNRLSVPYWALPADDILEIFVGYSVTGGAQRQFRELVQKHRRAFLEKASWLDLDPAAVTSDTPIPFDIKTVWYQLDYENNETRETKGDPDSVCIEEKGVPADLKPTRFKPYGAGGSPPHQSGNYNAYGRVPELLRLGLIDPRLRFFCEPFPDPEGDSDPLLQSIGEWLGSGSPVSVLDFSGVPAGAADVAIGVILNLLFEVSLRGDPDSNGIGRSSPVLIVLEEAHRYLGEDASRLTRESANRIAREGRKYGVGLMLVSQRPDELPKTALAQCGTLISLRLSNAGDQGTIRAALPDTVSGLAAVLPSLRTGEAIISGEALVLPARVIIDRPDPAPRAEDPSLEPWRSTPKPLDVEGPLRQWRGVYQESTEGE